MTRTRSSTPTSSSLQAQPTASDAERYVTAIEKLADRAALVEFWAKIENNETPEFKDGKALEYFVLQAFKVEGAEVTWPYDIRLSEVDDDGTESTGEQIDGAIFVDGIHVLVESKHEKKTAKQTGRVDIEPIAKLRNQLLRRPALTVGVIFSMNGFTPAAKTLTRYIAPQTILLWDGNDIREALHNEHLGLRGGLRKKLRWAVERGLPDLPLKDPLAKELQSV